MITYDEAAWEYGDDTTSGIIINGELKVSRTVNTSLTCKWDLKTWSATTATINWWRRSISDPIPAWVTATLILNYSAVMANFKWGMYIAEASNAYFCGATKTINTYVITSNLAVSATSAIVNDITWWAIGDNIIFAASDGNYSHWETKTLTSVTPWTGLTGTVWWSVGLSYTHAINCPVWNRTSNVTVKNYNTTTVAYVCFFHNSATSNNRREVDYTSFEYVGSNTANPTTQCFIASNTNSITTPFLTFSNNFFFQCNQSSTLFIYLWNSNGFDMTNLGFFSTNGSFASNTYTAAWTFVKISNSVYYYNNGINHVSAYSQGGQGCILSGNTYCSSASAHINNGNGDGLSVVLCRFHSSSGTALVQLSAWSVNFSTCNFWDSTLWGTPEFSYVVNAGSAPWQVFRGTMSDSKFWNPATSFYQNLSLVNPSYLLTIINKNISVTSQEEYSYAGVVVRDNATINRSPSSNKFNPQTTGRAFTRTYKIPAPNNTARRVIWYLNYDTNYGVWTPPSVTLSGLWITPVTYNATTINTWNKFDLSATQTSGNDGNLTLTVSGKSTVTNWFFWVDGISDDPFITNCRHYGFLFDGLIYRSVDPIIQTATETTVGSYTGIAISWSTITLTVNHSVRELYDYCKWYLCQTANLSVADFFTSTDWVNFTSTYNIILTNANLTGTANITTTGTLTVTGTSTSTPIITASNGKTGYLNISGLSGHTVYLQDGSGVQKDYQASVTGTYSYFLSNVLTGTWTYVIKKTWYTYQKGTFTPSTGWQFSISASTPQKFNPNGTIMYQASNSLLATIAFTGTTQANIRIWDGEISAQQAFDMTETALVTNAGMIWLTIRWECSIFLSPWGNYLFLSDKWRIQRRTAGDVNASLSAFVTSSEGVVVDNVNGWVQFLSSSWGLTTDQATQLANTVKKWDVILNKWSISIPL